ncbi:MAG: peptidase [Eggerthellaceae bacterium]|nr:peptidase [Eggerthellaceae bacterium]
MVGRTSAPPSGASPLTRLVSLLIAVVLSVGLMPAVPAWADDAAPAADQPTVTLTVLAGTTTDYNTNTTTYTTWVNKQYAFDEGDTLEDLLNDAVAAGDLKAYTAPESTTYGGKYIESITSQKGVQLKNWNNADFSVSLYWAYYQNGDYGQGDCAIDHVKLTDGAAYQFAWSSFTQAGAPEWTSYYQDNAVDGAQADAITLTVTAGSKTDYSTGDTSTVTWVNKAYSRADVLAAAKAALPAGSPEPAADDLTVADLLNTAVAAGDLKAYAAPESSYGGRYIDAITSKAGVELKKWNNDDSSLSLYWAYFQDGGYGQGDCAIDHVKLTDGAAYQFAWDGFTSAVAPADAAAWGAYYRDNPATPVAPGAGDDKPAEGDKPATGDDVTPPADEHPATGVSQQAIGSLMSAIAASYQGTSEPWPVMDLAALGMADQADLDAFYADALAAAKDPGFDPTALQRSIIALTAAGYDATALPDGDGTFDAVAALGQRVSGATVINARMAALWAYASGDYAVPADATLSQDALLASVLADQLPDGGFTLSGTKATSDMTAMAIAALAPYRDDPQVAAALDRAVTALHALQLPDGGFADNEGLPNACSTAFSVIALCAAGIDPATQWAVEGGATPLSALLSYGLDDLSGFAFEADGDRDENATEQGFRALVAYRGLVAARERDGAQATYDLYAQAREGIARIPGDEGASTPDEGADAGDGAADQPARGGQLAPTGDDGAAAAVASSALALGALACLLAARKRMADGSARDLVGTRTLR